MMGREISWYTDLGGPAEGPNKVNKWLRNNEMREHPTILDLTCISLAFVCSKLNMNPVLTRTLS